MSRFDAELFALRPWYHDFSALGFDTIFRNVPLTPGERARRAAELVSSKLRRIRPGPRTSPVPKEQVRSIREVFRRVPSSHMVNQPVKEKHLFGFIRRALSDLPPSPSCLELFCADGYYSCQIKTLEPRATVTGIDLAEDHIARATTMARRLDLQGITFRREDVWAFLERSSERHDLVLCAGGLYHLSAPARLLAKLRSVSRGYVVLQTVVTLETEDRDYFVSPAPGWQHGCRFTHAWLLGQLADLGWRIVAESRAELPGNPRPQDRGSSFLLCHVR
jgi:2-polyprenyl-3-methyl-5-hydroxy-6-metoxy-1,4-benzoquinol methylase